MSGGDNIRIERQVFAQVTHIDDFTTCEEEEGILGLANTRTSTHGFPTVLGNILHQSQHQNTQVLKYNMFGMYLRSDLDDYASQDQMSSSSIAGRTERVEPRKSSSELILGGINQDHYLGCLEWHDLYNTSNYNNNNNSDDNDRTNYDKYWTIEMQDVRVGGVSLLENDNDNGNADTDTDNYKNNLIAVLDSGSSYIIGPQEPVAKLVQMNNAKCFTMNQKSSNSGDAEDDVHEPMEVDCMDPDGFDGAILSNCNDPFFNLEFVVNGMVYTLSKQDFMIQIDTLLGEACILRIVASKGIQVRYVVGMCIFYI